MQKLPTDKLEEAVMSGAKEVGRAIESVAHTIEKEVTKRGTSSASQPPVAAPSAESTPAAASTGTTPPGESGSSAAPPDEPKA